MIFFFALDLWVALLVRRSDKVGVVFGFWDLAEAWVAKEVVLVEGKKR